MIAGFTAAAVLLPAWVAIESTRRAPMLDLTLFNNRLFAAASAAAFINGLARFALMFLFVFYFQGAQGNDPVTRGRQADPAGAGHADRLPPGRHLRRSPRLALAGRDRNARQRGGLAADDDAAGRQPLLAERDVAGARRDRLGHVQQPEHRGDDGHRARAPARHRRRRAHAAAEHRRGALDRVRDGDRHLGDPEATLFAIFSGLANGLSPERLAPFIHNMHVALWALSIVSLIGAGVCLLRPRTPSSRRRGGAARGTHRRGRSLGGRVGGRLMAGAQGDAAALRIGEVARAGRHDAAHDPLLRGNGLLPEASGRPSGGHRIYTDAEVARLQEVMRLKSCSA